MITIFTRRSVAFRLSLAFAMMVAMMLAITAVNGLALRDAGNQLQRIVETNNRRADLAHRMLAHIDELEVQARSIALLSDIPEIDAEFRTFQAAALAYESTQRALAQAVGSGDSDAEERRLAVEIDRAAARALPPLHRAVEQGRAGESIEATTTLMVQVRPAERAWRNLMGDFVALEDKLSHDSYVAARASQRAAIATALALVCAAASIAGLIAWRILRGVKGPIDHAVKVAERIAEGDLSTRVDVASHDEFGKLLAAISAMQARLRLLVGRIQDTATHIQSATSEVASGNLTLSRRTEEAAANLQSTAANMDQMTRSVRDSAEAAARANKMAEGAAEVALRGGQTVGLMVATMRDIDDSSRRIADIIGTIDGIAFQTNILALNAGVEAARAGDRGRNFAVVASEVRALAQRSATAAKEIKDLVNLSAQRVEAGNRLVADAGTRMQAIVRTVQDVSALIRDISSASERQASGVARISRTVNDLDQLLQQNATLVDESAAATQSLGHQALDLMTAVSTFRMAGDQEESAFANPWAPVNPAHASREI